MNYRLSTVPGSLTVGEWGPADAPPCSRCTASRGRTSRGPAWRVLLPELHFVAPDLRGRGRSRELPGPFGMTRHADDLADVLDHLQIEKALVVGHSMGAFASLVFSLRHADRSEGLVLVDGGLPIALPHGVTVEDTLGPAAARLTMTFSSRDEYLQLWRQHPAIVGNWSPDVEAYVDYDLIGTAPELHSSATVESMARDSHDLVGTTEIEQALAALRAPTPLLTAPRGLLNEAPLYSADTLSEWHDRIPALEIVEAADTNHYTIVLGAGAPFVAAAIRSAV